MDKIKINLDMTIIDKLNSDMKLFNFYKKNKQINKNGFLNTLLHNYFPIYENMASKSIVKYNKIISSHIEDKEKSKVIINKLLESDKLFSYNKKSHLIESISFKPNNYNKQILNIIMNKYTQHQSTSSFFRNLLENYFSLPQYKREQIIYLNTYELISEAIQDGRKISLYLNDEKIEVYPYKIVTNEEELFNYLICFKDNKHKSILSIHLYKISCVYLLPEIASIANADLEKLEKVASTSPQFPHYNNKNTIIELNKAGQNMFENKYLNRPIPYKIENNRYYFNCSYNQIVVYFFSFAKNAKIIEPEELKETFKKMYLEAYQNYNE